MGCHAEFNDLPSDFGWEKESLSLGSTKSYTKNLSRNPKPNPCFPSCFINACSQALFLHSKSQNPF